MIMQRTIERLRRSGSVPVLAAALLLAAGSVRAERDQDARSPANDSSDGARVEAPRAEPQESPSEPASAPAPEAPSEPPSEPPSEAPAEPPSEPSGPTAVPTVPDAGRGPNRQPPTQHRGGGHGDDDDGVIDGGDDGYLGGEDSLYEEDDSGYSLPSPYPGNPYHGRSPHAGMGALDLDIKPSRARVFLNGQPIGKADAFDGWPKYLWLPEGTYDLVFYLHGFQTLGRRMTVRRALVVDMDDHLRPGPSIRPEDFRREPRK